MNLPPRVTYFCSKRLKPEVTSMASAQVSFHSIESYLTQLLLSALRPLHTGGSSLFAHSAPQSWDQLSSAVCMRVHAPQQRPPTRQGQHLTIGRHHFVSSFTNGDGMAVVKHTQELDQLVLNKEVVKPSP